MAGIEIATGELVKEVDWNCGCALCQQHKKIVRGLMAEYKENLEKMLIVAFIQGAKWWNFVWCDGNVEFDNDRITNEVKLAAEQKLKKGLLGVQSD